jgi:hypothetical protein
VNADFFARSLKFWGSEQSSYHACRVPVFPATAYNYLLQDEAKGIYAGRLGQHTPDKLLLIALVDSVLRSWKKPYDEFSLQQLRWALTNVPRQQQEQILTIFNREIINPMKDTSQTNLSPDVVSKLRMSLASLEQSLLAKDSMMPSHLRASHQLLSSYPETVHLLADAEIARLISAAQIHTQIEIVKASTASAGRKKKITVDDL